MEPVKEQKVIRDTGVWFRGGKIFLETREGNFGKEDLEVFLFWLRMTTEKEGLGID
jgi:hypothetical protein